MTWFMRIVALLLFPICAGAQTVGYHPSSPLYLGANFDPENLRDFKVPCMKDATTTTVAVDNGAPSTEFRSAVLKERRELYDAFSVSASYSASAGLAGGNGSVSYVSEVNFDFESVVWTMMGKSNYGRVSVGKVELLPAYASLPAATLAAICGTHFVVMERREAVAAAIFTFRTSSRKTREQLTTALSGNWTGGSMSANLSKELRESLARTDVSFSFVAKGGGGMSATSGFVTTFDKFDELRQQVAAYVAGVTRETAPAAEYYYAKLPVVPNMNLMLDARERALSNIWTDYLRNDGIVKEARKRLNELDRYWYLDKETLRTYLTNAGQTAAKKIDELSTTAGECTADKQKCNYVAEFSPPNVEWPSVDAVNNTWGWGCSPAPNCSGFAGFLVKFTGPDIPRSIVQDRIGVGMPGSNMGYNCRNSQPKMTAFGMQFDCIMSFNSTTVTIANADLQISDLAGGAVAFRSKLKEIAPDITMP